MLSKTAPTSALTRSTVPIKSDIPEEELMVYFSQLRSLFASFAENPSETALNEILSTISLNIPVPNDVFESSGFITVSFDLLRARSTLSFGVCRVFAQLLCATQSLSSLLPSDTPFVLALLLESSPVEGSDCVSAFIANYSSATIEFDPLPVYRAVIPHLQQRPMTMHDINMLRNTCNGVKYDQEDCSSVCGTLFSLLIKVAYSGQSPLCDFAVWSLFDFLSTRVCATIRTFIEHGQLEDIIGLLNVEGSETFAEGVLAIIQDLILDAHIFGLTVQERKLTELIPYEPILPFIRRGVKVSIAAFHALRTYVEYNSNVDLSLVDVCVEYIEKHQTYMQKLAAAFLLMQILMSVEVEKIRTCNLVFLFGLILEMIQGSEVVDQAIIVFTAINNVKIRMHRAGYGEEIDSVLDQTNLSDVIDEYRDCDDEGLMNIVSLLESEEITGMIQMLRMNT